MGEKRGRWSVPLGLFSDHFIILSLPSGRLTRRRENMDYNSGVFCPSRGSGNTAPQGVTRKQKHTKAARARRLHVSRGITLLGFEATAERLEALLLNCAEHRRNRLAAR